MARIFRSDVSQARLAQCDVTARTELTSAEISYWETLYALILNQTLVVLCIYTTVTNQESMFQWVNRFPATHPSLLQYTTWVESCYVWFLCYTVQPHTLNTVQKYQGVVCIVNLICFQIFTIKTAVANLGRRKNPCPQKRGEGVDPSLQLSVKK